MRNGFDIVVIKTKLFNKMVESGTLKERAISDKVYLQRNLDGSLRKYGYNAFSYNNSYWGKTRKLALEKAKENNA